MLLPALFLRPPLPLYSYAEAGLCQEAFTSPRLTGHWSLQALPQPAPLSTILARISTWFFLMPVVLPQHSK